MTEQDDDLWGKWIPSWNPGDGLQLMNHDLLIERNEQYGAWWAALPGGERAGLEKRIESHHEHLRVEDQKCRDREIQRRRGDAASRMAKANAPILHIRKLESRAIEDTEAVTAASEALAAGARLIVLLGGVGVGKTQAAAFALAKAEFPDLFLESIADEDWRGEPACIPFQPHKPDQHWYDAQQLVRISQFDEDRHRQLERVSTLVIDDLGTEALDDRGAILARIDGLLNQRYANERTTIITSNLKPQQLRTRYGDRLADRLREVGAVYTLGGKSMRGAK